MVRLGCTCGYAMGGSYDPNKSIINVFLKSEVDDVLSHHRDITLFDYETEVATRDYEYWYCPSCHRVHEVRNLPIPYGVVERRFIPAQGMLTNSEEMIPLYIFAEEEIYDAEEEDFDLTLSDFIDVNGPSHIYYLNREKNEVYRQEGNAMMLIYAQE